MNDVRLYLIRVETIKRVALEEPAMALAVSPGGVGGRNF